MQVNNLDDMIGYVKIQMGSGYTENGVIVLEMTTEQIQSCIYDACSYAIRYFGDATYEAYVGFTVSAGVSDYSLSGTDIVSVIDLSYGAGGTQGINVLFSPTNLIFQGKFDIFNGQAAVLTDWEIFNNFLYNINRMFAIEYRLIYNEMMQQLTVIPTPTSNGTTVLKTYKKIPMINLYNNILVKGLILAKVKKLYSRSLRKYGNSLQTPGGGQLFTYGEALANESAEDERKFENAIRSEQEPLGFMTG